MRTIPIITVLICGCCFASEALANCENIITLSKVTSAVALNRDQFQSTLDNFCREQKNSSGKSANGSLSLGPIGLGGGGSSSNQSYDQYCQQNQNKSFGDEAFRQYVESISPRAYDAYEKCLKSVGVDFDLTAMNAKYFTLLVSFSSRNDLSKAAIVSYVPNGDGVICQWENQMSAETSPAASNTSPAQMIGHGRTYSLQCTRQDYKKEDQITIYRADSSDHEQLTIPWRRYNDDLIPVDTVEELANSLNKLRSDVSALSGKYSAKLYKCPTGWKDPNKGMNAFWISQGCLGQISTVSSCNNQAWHGPNNPMNTDDRECTEIGVVHLFSSPDSK